MKKADQTILVVNNDVLDFICRCVAEAPYRVANPVLTGIVQQANDQELQTWTKPAQASD